MLAENQRYYENFSGIINGQVKYEDLTPPKDDKNTNTETQNPEELDNIDVVDSQFRKSYEGSVQEDFGIGAQDNNGSLQRVMLFAPLRNSVVVKKYDLKEPHYGLDLAANKGSRIKAVADGTVLTASWTQDGGHVIAIQHSNDLVSFYKHNSELLHEVGDFVKAGEDIAIIGNSGEQTDGPHLHLELWYRGSPVNPEYFIAF
ncbi:MAG: M23 family metallopeptidase [Cytophagales bacterium]|nr:MAG: M23 family metallopeptidase [Cytophagales bacterium]TAF60334.1 MAG: M23 family metallopeptidase [Cytophagales bacterium]